MVSVRKVTFGGAEKNVRLECVRKKKGFDDSLLQSVYHPRITRTAADAQTLTRLARVASVARMTFDVETGCRLALGVMILGTATIGIPHRLRADRASGHVSARVDPSWF